MKDSIISSKLLNATWIVDEVDESKVPECPYFRIEFEISQADLEQPIILDLSALGVVRAFLNGFRVGEDELTPGYTDSRKRNYFFRYSVNHLLRPGKNVLGAIVADGWHSGHIGWYKQAYGTHRGLWCRLTIGDREIITTESKGWKTAIGAYLAGDLLMGETFDARKIPHGWDQPDFKDGQWTEVTRKAHPGILELARHPAIRVTRLRDANHIQTVDGKRIYDVGQNLAGRCWIEVKGKPGDTVTLRHAEVLDDKGNIYTANLRNAKATDVYFLAGTGEVERYEPAFTFHGFRYVEVTSEAEVTRVGVHAYHSDVTFHGWFQCADSRINQLHSNIEWSMRGNFLDVPTDCPQRDERLGWTGDAEVFMPTACLLADVKPFFDKWLIDFLDAQRADGAIPPVVPSTAMYMPNSTVVQEGGPAWSDAFTICAWHHWTNYKDPELIKQIWPGLNRFVEFLHQTSKDGERCYDGYPGFGGFGDWLTPGPETDHALLGTAYYAWSCKLASRLAAAIGVEKPELDVWVAAASAAYMKRFKTKEKPTQTACILALQFGLCHPDEEAAIAKTLGESVRANGLLTGFVGTAHLCEVLSLYGYDAEAYQVLLHPTWPGWLFPVAEGATTMWERWDGWDPVKGFEDAGMNSFNHYAYGAVGQWLYNYMAGIRWDESVPGNQKVIFNPRPDPRVQWVSAGTQGVYSSWRYVEGKWKWLVSTEVDAWLIPPPGMKLTQDSKPVPDEGLALGPGRYQFISA